VLPVIVLRVVSKLVSDCALAGGASMHATPNVALPTSARHGIDQLRIINAQPSCNQRAASSAA
jgi:hypothetical protein